MVREESDIPHDLTDDLIAELGEIGENAHKHSMELLNDNFDRDNWNPFESPRSNILKEGSGVELHHSNMDDSPSDPVSENSFADERDMLEKLESACRDEGGSRPSIGEDTESGQDARNGGLNSSGAESCSTNKDSLQNMCGRRLFEKQLT